MYTYIFKNKDVSIIVFWQKNENTNHRVETKYVVIKDVLMCKDVLPSKYR